MYSRAVERRSGVCRGSLRPLPLSLVFAKAVFAKAARSMVYVKPPSTWDVRRLFIAGRAGRGAASGGTRERKIARLRASEGGGAVYISFIPALSKLYLSQSGNFSCLMAPAGPWECHGIFWVMMMMN